mmetsp:Transcript_29213/g.74252  ORF Transcript_29213/g.74252 Transcript_29213/m.74252 type:complete len:630 (-) Transcript_29213:368-2257(-)
MALHLCAVPLLAALLSVPSPAAAVTARLSVDIHNLSLSLISGEQELQLAQALAAEVASAVLEDPGSILSLDGEPGRVSLVGPSAVKTSSTSFVPTTATATQPTLPPLNPLRGVAYRALPCRDQHCGGEGIPSEDLLQAGYSAQWGAEGRDDLAIIRNLGGNAVRTYHSIGDNTMKSHGGFLDRAEELGMNVLPGYHTDLVTHAGICPDFDCFEDWKNLTLNALELGYRRDNGWHPAIAALVLFDEPDHFEHQDKCDPPGPWCRVKAVLSAVEGVLAAEQEAGVEPGRVKLAVTWSFAVKESIDGAVEAAGVYGFQDMRAAVANPAIANYTLRLPQAEFEQAMRERWVNGLNTNAPWTYVNGIVTEHYSGPTPWFLGAYGASELERAIIEADLESMDQLARSNVGFLGAVFNEFQTAYHRGGSELNFGLFSLGEATIARTGTVCDALHPCSRRTVHCLGADLSEWLPTGTRAQRAQAVAAAWGGQIAGAGLCATRRLAASEEAAWTRVGCLIRKADSVSLDSITAALQGVQRQLVSRTVEELGESSTAIVGALQAGALRVEEAPALGAVDEEETSDKHMVSRGWTFVGFFMGLAVGACCAGALVCVALSRSRLNDSQGAASTPSHYNCEV